jgi:hypothetical protein
MTSPSPAVITQSEVSSIGAGALSILWEAYAAALSIRENIWNFAVELDQLQTGGLSLTELRWLVSKGYVEHAVETFPGKPDGRRFKSVGRFSILPSTCVVLTPVGARWFIDAVVRRPRGDAAEGNGQAGSAVSSESALVVKPDWDRATRTLCLGREIIKRFQRVASAQQLILEAFEEEGWPQHIDDPLPPRPGVKPAHRLHHAINNLNRGLAPLIRFRGDGLGRGIRWEMFLVNKARFRRARHTSTPDQHHVNRIGARRHR